MNVNFHPAPGFGELLNGWHVVPQNPITAAQATIVYGGMGELVPGRFPVPQNPLLPRALGGCGCKRTAGMGVLDFSTAWESLSAGASGAWESAKSIAGVNPWVLGGGLAVLGLLLFRPGGSEYRRAISSAKAKYRDEVSRIRSRYPRVAGRARRAAGAF